MRDIDDVVQESYLRIWKSRAGAPFTSARSFLFKVARNVTLDWLRRRAVSPEYAVGDLDALPVLMDGRGVAESVSAAERIGLLADALVTLPPRGSTIINLRKFQGLPAREVAVRLGISEKTVEEHLYRATKRLGAYLRRRGVDGHFER